MPEITGSHFFGKYNVFISKEKMIDSNMEVGQMAKCTDTGVEYQVMATETNYGIRLSNGNYAVALSEIVREFDTLLLLKKHPTLKVGDKCRTWGENLLGDTGAADYVIVPAEGSLIKGDVTLDNGLLARMIIRDASHHEKVNHVTVPKGTTTINTGLVNLSKNPKVFFDGLLMIPGEHYTISSNSKGILELTRPFVKDIKLMVVDSMLYSGAATNTGERYNTFIVPKNTNDVDCGITKLSARPTLIINGMYLILGKHWDIKDAATGIITIYEGYVEDAEGILIDDHVSGIPDAGTLSGFTHHDFIKQIKNIQQLIAGTQNGIFEVGDIVMVMEPWMHLRQLSYDNEGDNKNPKGVDAGNGLFWNYYWREEQYVATNIADLQKATKYALGNVVNVLGNETRGDGFQHQRIKVETQTATTVPALDGSGHWEILPNSMLSDKANTGGSTKTIADIDRDKVNVGRQVKSGNGLSGGGSLENDVTLKVVTDPNSPALSVSERGIALEIINDLTTGGVNGVLSAEQGKVLKQLIDSIGSGGVLRLLKIDEKYAENTSIGVLTANGKDIVVGKMLFQPVLYLQGIRQAEDTYTVDLQSGLITLKNVYANFPVAWVVEDAYLPHIKFSFNTLNLLMASEEMKSRIELGDVIKILGESDADDGDHRLIKCENVKKLNGVQLAENKWLNEIPNTRIKTVTTNLSNQYGELNTVTLNTLGVTLGNNGVTYIQDPGQKIQGIFYMDKNSTGLWKCITTTSSVNNDSNFRRVDLNTISDKSYNVATFRLYDSETHMVNKQEIQLSDSIYNYEMIVVCTGDIVEDMTITTLPSNLITTNRTFSIVAYDTNSSQLQPLKMGVIPDMTTIRFTSPTTLKVDNMWMGGVTLESGVVATGSQTNYFTPFRVYGIIKK